MASKINEGTYASPILIFLAILFKIKNVDQWQNKVHETLILVFLLVSYLSKNICKKGFTLTAQKYHVKS